VVYLLEFLVFEDGGKRVIESMTHRAESVGAAQNYARSVLKNVTIHDKRPDLCEVKDQKGRLLGVVSAPT
jgi:hypothetical protein